MLSGFGFDILTTGRSAKLYGIPDNRFSDFDGRVVPNRRAVFEFADAVALSPCFSPTFREFLPGIMCGERPNHRWPLKGRFFQIFNIRACKQFDCEQELTATLARPQ